MEEFWDRMAKTYDLSTEKKYRHANERIIQCTKQYCKKTDNLLDLGCGTGSIIIDLANYINQASAVDSSAEMLKIAREKAKCKNISNIKFEQKDILEHSVFQKQYRIITSFNILLYVNQLNSLLKDIHDALPSGGYFISATDCLGENHLLKFATKLFCRIGAIPTVRCFDMIELENILNNTGFQIKYAENVHNRIPNYYIVAKKR